MVRMLTLLAAATLVKLAYSFPVEVKRVYDVKTVFEGYIPILGGHEGKIEVNLVVTAQGLKPAADGAAQVLSTLDDIKVIYNGAPLPFVTLDNAKEYFPPTTISMSPFGATIKTNAPDVQAPVKLPGLDVKRFPDITYLPLQLPEGEAAEGKAYTFKRTFGDSDITYTVTPTKIGDETVEMTVAVSQTYEVLEDEGKEVVKSEKDAVARVRTDMSGTGTATFDRKLGVFKIVNVTANADSAVVDIETKKLSSTRKVKSTLTIKLKA
jgi:hypothetical protein